ncbi:hypothetical protein [Nonomuraea sp. LPB2021202275-12-8]|uniref:hypothetical protein n=1 Tax=Nonomuraea sp. LPB2021202275-12-8 TaxID=3120159 RepID=UPI00300D811B
MSSPTFTDPPQNAPDGDDFFTRPTSLPAGEYGDPIYQRLLTNPVAALEKGRNWLVLYLSEKVKHTRRSSIASSRP